MFCLKIRICTFNTNNSYGNDNKKLCTKYIWKTQQKLHKNNVIILIYDTNKYYVIIMLLIYEQETLFLWYYFNLIFSFNTKIRALFLLQWVVVYILLPTTWHNQLHQHGITSIQFKLNTFFFEKIILVPLYH